MRRGGRCWALAWSAGAIWALASCGDAAGGTVDDATTNAGGSGRSGLEPAGAGGSGGSGAGGAGGTSGSGAASGAGGQGLAGAGPVSGTGATSGAGADGGVDAAMPALDAGADSAVADGGASGSPDTGTAPGDADTVLPPITDPGADGPFEIAVQETLEGLDTHILIAPRELGRDAIKHPIIVWVNGAGAGSSSYRNMLDNVAAHGFFLLDDKQSSSVPQEVTSQRAAIDWAIAQNERQGGPYFGKLDTKRIAIAGHSLGSVTTFGNVSDTRIKTSIHMAGGVVGNPQGVDEGWIKQLHAPAAFVIGTEDRASALDRVRNDFAGAPPTVPVFYGVLSGVTHTGEFSEPNGGRWGRFVIAWLRWKLADDPSFAKSFMGADCEFCKDGWSAMKRGID